MLNIHDFSTVFITLHKIDVNTTKPFVTTLVILLTSEKEIQLHGENCRSWRQDVVQSGATPKIDVGILAAVPLYSSFLCM